jgi:membrane associated rhomboid family serine protease
MSQENFDSYPYLAPGRRPIAWVTWLIVGSTVAVFLLQLLFLHLYGGGVNDIVGNTLAFGPQAWADGRYWTLITYAWAHAVIMFDDPGLFWLHIAANMIFLACLGPAVEEFLGPWRFLGLYLGGALAAALVWFFFNPNTDGIIGASGAVFAVVAGAGTAAPRARIILYLFYFLPIRMNMGTMALVCCGLEAAQAFFGWMPGIAHSAHLGGAAFGFLYVLAVRLMARNRYLSN